VKSGSKRHAVELLPGTLVPGIASLVGFVLIGRAAGARELGFVSLAWVVSSWGSSVIAEGPATAALRTVATGTPSRAAGFRRVVWLRVALWTPVGVALGALLDVAGADVGRSIAFGSIWAGAQALALFEIQVLKAENRFLRASWLACARAALGWGVSVAAAYAVGTLGAIVLTNVVVSLVVIVLIGSTAIARADDGIRRDSRAIGRPVTMLLFAGYLLGYGDRFVIQAIIGPAAVGIYTLGYQLGDGGIELVSAPVTSALLPRLVAEWNDTAKGPSAAIATARRGAAAHLVAGAAAVPVVLAASALGFLDLVSPSYDITAITCIVSVACAINGIARLAFGLLLAQGRPQVSARWAWVVVGLSAVTVPLLTWLHGITGAAVATLIGYTALAVLYSREALRGAR
jgi:O-antigen/teichoic acid export membrane protein